LATAQRIRLGGLTEESWRRGWSSLAERLLAEPPADEAEARPSSRTRGERAARASSYFRTAEFFAPYQSEVRRDLFDRARAAFRAAIPELPIEVEVIAVGGGDVVYDGYVFRGRGASRERPQPGVVFLGGADSYAE